MLYLQATKKTLHALGLPNESLSLPGETASALGNWFVNVVPIGGREAYLFMSTRSLLSFPAMIGKLRPGPADMLSFLEHGFALLSKSMKAPRNQTSLVMQDFSELALCAPQNKSVIGIHSAIAADYFHRVNRAGGLPQANLGEVISQVNSSPRAPLGFRTSFEVSIELLAASEA